MATPQDPQVANGDKRDTNSQHLSSPPILDEKDTTRPSQEGGPATGGWMKKLPTWISKPLSSPDDMKVLFRCWAILFGSTALLLAHPSLRTLGNAALFVIILNFMVPASMPIPLFIFVFTTLVLGMALGWAWGAAAVAAAYRARDQKLLASAVQRVQSGIASATRPDLAYREQIFRGAFLDVRSTVVFGVFFGLGAFFLGVVRAKAPPLALLSIFGTIVLDVMCSYAPLFPFEYYTVATQFLIPTACYIAIALAALILIFPRTLNHAWLNLYTTGFLRTTLASLSALSDALGNPTPLSAPSWSALDNAALARRLGLIGAVDGLAAQEKFLDIEPVVGLLSGSDVRALMPHAKEIVVGVLGTDAFVRSVRERLEDLAHEGETVSPSGPDDGKLKHLKETSYQTEIDNGVGLETLLPLLAAATEPLRTAMHQALSAATDWLDHANHSRWRPKARLPATSRADRERLLSNVRDELAAFRSSRRLGVIEPFARFFDPKTGAFTGDPLKARLSGRTLYLCFAFETSLVALAGACVCLLERVDTLEEKRTRRRLWWPTGLRHLGTLLIGGKGARAEDTGFGGGEDPSRLDILDDDDTVNGSDRQSGKQAAKANNGAPKKNAKVERVDLDARAPKTALGRFGRALFSAYMWFWSPEAVFGLRYTIASIALWLPAVFPSSAWINYTEKGLWALIMAQTGLGVYAGDQIANLVKRTVGTAAGLVLGMLIWYVGAGDGNGNPYGIAASFLSFSVFLLFIRLYCAQYQMESIMMTVTAGLIVAYSYQDNVLFTLGNPGAGVNVAWRRALLVLIGVGAAFVVSMFPRPQSTRSMVRRTLATTTDELASLYLSAVEAWIAEDPELTSEALPSDTPSGVDSKTLDALRARGLGVLVKLKGIVAELDNAKWELSLRGPWPADEYIDLLQKQKAFFAAILQLSQAFKMLTPQWRKDFARRSALLNPNLVSEVSTTLAIVAHSLRSGTPLPPALPTPLLTRVLHHDAVARHQRAARARATPAGPRSGTVISSAADDDDDTPSLLQMEGVTASGAHEITLDVLRDEQFQMNAAAAVALLALLAQVDAMVGVLERLAGRAELKGWAELRAKMGDDQV